MKNGLFRIALPWLVVALLVPLAAAAFIAKPVEAG
jgi:hypothetical protein